MNSELKTEGTIVKGIGGFYYVDAPEGYFECRARGSFRKDGITPLVGDRAVISVNMDSKKGSVDEILPRKNFLLRPPVANVTQMAVVIAAANPRPNLYLTDKLLASAELAEIDTVICVNKTDVGDAEELCRIYRSAGYCVIPTCAADGTNIDLLKEKLCGAVTVFAGNSGVGKSSILNCVTESGSFETGEVSEKAERGRHTTRHAELVRLDFGGYIIDTPGFGIIDVASLKPENCAELFREIAPLADGCRFGDCRHRSEPGCKVLDAVKCGSIAPSRHESYIRLLGEIETAERRRTK